MSIWRLVVREIRFRAVNSLLSVFSILAATGCLVAAVSSLQLHDGRIQDLSQRKKAEMERIMTEHEDMTRRDMLALGFNVLIVHKDEDRRKLLAGQSPQYTMPEGYVQALTGSVGTDGAKEKGIVSLNHLLPMLREQLTWDNRVTARNLAAHTLLFTAMPAAQSPLVAAGIVAGYRPLNTPVIVAGTVGEVPIVGHKDKRPLIPAVSSGGLLMGHGIHQASGLEPGDEVELSLAREVRYGNTIEMEQLPPVRLRVERVLQRRGTEQDITIWLDLAEAQKLLRKPGLINGIFALECVSPECTTDRFHEVEPEIARRLPGTQVVPYYSAAAVRATARARAAKLARDTIDREIAQQVQLKEQHESFASLLTPLVMLGAVIWLGVLAFGNVRERIAEIGILRALGVRSPQVFTLFIAKALVIGLVGGLLGYAAGVGIVSALGTSPEAADSVEFFQPVLLAIVLLGAPLLGALASFMPALWAAGQDPALILQHE